MAEEVKEEVKEEKPKKKGFFKEFKEFINKGNAFMLAVGVVIGGAFSAIVNSLVSILMSVATWAVPGGLKGLVTVLPALNDAQKGMNPGAGLGQFFEASQLQDLAVAQAEATYPTVNIAENPNLVENVKSAILGKYTLHGTTYTYNMSAVIDWGAFINAVISFIIIALTLFIIVKVLNRINNRRLLLAAKAKAEIEEKVAKAKEKKEAKSASKAKVVTKKAEVTE